MSLSAHTRRQFLYASAAFTGLSAVSASAAFSQKPAASVSALPLSDVRLLPSPFKTALDVNETYLLTLDPDRFLHNFRKGAGLKPKAEAYGGWEQDTIAGHSLGHYLSAISLMYAQTGNPVLKQRAGYVIDELALIQGAQGDGYVAGFLRKRKDGTVVDGKEIFPEIMAGDIRSAGFDLNGCWVPFYNWHKLYSGLFDAQSLCGYDKAIPVAVGLSIYIDKVFAALNDQQVQTVLDCEHGGINDSFAELYQRTQDPRWLKLSQRLYHHRVMDPMVAREDKLANIHSNTNIPKVLGVARLYDITGEADYRTAADFFWERVTGHHSYVIGGNGDREYFFAADTISKHITEATCEHCATYNMMKLTRDLYRWSPDARYFDYFERAHFNHILAQQNPKTGMFSYMTPLFTGAARGFSDPVDNWTCCHGSGMESHAKHAESIYWQKADTLLVNLYIPSTAKWAAKGAAVRLDTGYPFDGEARLSLTSLRRPSRFKVALRVPGWAKTATLTLNGKRIDATRDGGYLVIDRVWQAGDRIALSLPLDLRVEPTGDNPGVVAILRGPLVLAADLGSVEDDYKATDPALVGNDLLAGFTPVAAEKAHYKTVGIGRPSQLQFVPFYSQWERRSAVYFKAFNEADWKIEETAFLAEQERQRDLAARSVDVMHLGEMQAERDHNLESEISWPGTYRGRNGRDARSGGFMSFTMKVKPGPLVMQASYWGDDKCDFDILIDGQTLTTVSHKSPKPGEFFDEQYPVPEALTQGKTSVTVKLVPHEGRSTAMVFGVLLFTAAPAGTPA
ncbi:glycoside hydrolase family 127 protein [Asticcacaulis sp. 201]|uniref:glycoside hydrolase family 127 protein n=1 Tax=Asticcacaulis sp. 201 TaxID=3028787 RepID=UPI0029167128|nr:glycoside hydrolase family 127 protein [Asticcacaulis sp. 201]MDV6330347.1 glycoside hydrolase family 127 protein [Asticcacaulis sp. 201]